MWLHNLTQLLSKKEFSGIFWYFSAFFGIFPHLLVCFGMLLHYFAFSAINLHVQQLLAKAAASWNIPISDLQAVNDSWCNLGTCWHA